MLTTNIDVGDCLTNGAMGTVSAVILNRNKRIYAVLVVFDSEEIGVFAKGNSQYKHIDSCAVPVQRIEVSFSVKYSKHVRVSQTQYPLSLCWAVTIHKCQGMTLPAIVVDMSHDKGKFCDGQVYVAFSRVTQLNALHIINFSQEQIHVSHDVHEEMTRENRNMLPLISHPIISTVNRDTHLIIGHLNVCNIQSKQLDVLNDKVLKLCHAICFNETHLNTNQSVTPQMLDFDDTYIVFRNDQNSNGGGVMVVVDKQLQPMQILMVSNLEVIIVQVTINKHIMYIVSIYKTPQIRTQQWVTELKCILDIYKDCKVCVVGDLNENLFHDGIKTYT